MDYHLYNKFLKNVETAIGLDIETLRRMDVYHQQFFNLHRTEMRIRNNGVENQYIFSGRRLIWDYGWHSRKGLLRGLKNCILGLEVVSEKQMDDFLARKNFYPRFS